MGVTTAAGQTLSIIALLTIAAAPAASAKATSGKVVVIESNSLPRTEKSSKLVRSVVKALGIDVLHGDALRLALEKAYGRLPKPLPADRVAQIQQALQRGTKAAFAGDWAVAETSLKSVRQLLQTDVVAISRSKTLFTALQRARIYLSQVYLRTKRPKQAWELMKEVVRTEPSITLSSAVYGPALQKLFLRVRQSMERSRATLFVRSTPPGAVVFLSGRSIGFTPTKVQVYQGVYDLVVVHRHVMGRMHQLKVSSGARVVDIDTELHQWIARGSFKGITLRESAGRAQRETRFATQIGRRLGASRVILVGLRKVNGRDAIVGYGFGVSKIRPDAPAAALYLQGKGPTAQEPTALEPTAQDLKNLAQFLMGAPIAGKLAALSRVRLLPRAVSIGRKRTGAEIAGWSLVAIGLVAAAAGGVLVGVHNRIDATGDRPGAKYQTDREGYGLLGVGLGLGVIGAIVLVVDRMKRKRGKRERAMRVLPTPGGLVVMGKF